MSGASFSNRGQVDEWFEHSSLFADCSLETYKADAACIALEKWMRRCVRTEEDY